MNYSEMSYDFSKSLWPSFGPVYHFQHIADYQKHLRKEKEQKVTAPNFIHSLDLLVRKQIFNNMPESLRGSLVLS